MNFADRLSGLVAGRRSQLVLGLDPDPQALLPDAREDPPGKSPAERAAGAVARHCRLLIDAAGSHCVAVKPQLACFERLGPFGWQALQECVRYAQESGLLVIADGKRGDVPHTATAYGQALVGVTPTPWGDVRGLGADAATVNPLLGRDALEPMLAAGRLTGAGIFVLVRTSNPGAAEIQDIVHGTGEAPLHERLAALVRDLGSEHIGECGLSSVCAVTGATRPELVERLRQLMPSTIFLLPGIGAQGGSVESLAGAFAPAPAAGLVTAARSIVQPALDTGRAEDAAAAAAELRERAWAVSGGG